MGVALELALRAVNASEEQARQVRAIVERAIDQLAPVAERPWGGSVFEVELAGPAAGHPASAR